jgi:hypothetical protein
MDNYFICIVSFFVVLLSTSFASPFDSTLEDEFRANAELVCYECARTPDNDTCALDLKNIPEVTAVGQVGEMLFICFLKFSTAYFQRLTFAIKFFL